MCERNPSHCPLSCRMPCSCPSSIGRTHSEFPLLQAEQTLCASAFHCRIYFLDSYHIVLYMFFRMVGSRLDWKVPLISTSAPDFLPMSALHHGGGGGKVPNCRWKTYSHFKFPLNFVFTCCFRFLHSVHIVFYNIILISFEPWSSCLLSSLSLEELMVVYTVVPSPYSPPNNLSGRLRESDEPRVSWQNGDFKLSFSYSIQS